MTIALGKPRTGFHPPREKPSARAKRQDRRAAKFQLRAGLKPITANPTFRRCGTTPCSASGVGVRVTETSPGHRRAGFSGLSTCGSVWLCPVCAAKIAAGRAEELSTVLGNAKERGYQVAMVTLTVRHKATDPLEDVWGAVSRGWNRVTSGKAWQNAQRRYNIAGWARAVEVTHGAKGWHVHVHAAVIYDGTPADAHTLGASMFERWHAGITAAGFDALAGPGLDVQVAGDSLGKLGLYLAKLGADLPGLAREITQGSQKQARGKNRTPFQIAADAVATGNAQDIAIWAEWTRTAPGHRALTWSKHVRERFGLTTPETDDETLAAQETGTTDDTILVLPAPTWHALRPHAHILLDTAENHGPTALKTWLTSHGYTWHHPPQPPPSPPQSHS